MYLNRFFSQKGFSLTEALVGVAILGISTLAATSFLSYQMKANHQLQASQSRDFILRQIQTNLASSRAILTSKENIANQAYKYCVEGKKLPDGTLDKTICKNTLLGNGSEKTAFTLFSGQGSGAITGSPLKPQLYTAAGDPCAQSGPGCDIEATSWFVASCAGNAVSCATADSIEFRYLVQKSQTASIVMKPASGFFADPTMLDAASSNSGAVSNNASSLSCAPGSDYAGGSNTGPAYCCAMSPSGNIKCVNKADIVNYANGIGQNPYGNGTGKMFALRWRQLTKDEGSSVLMSGLDISTPATFSYGTICVSYGALACASSGSPCPNTDIAMCDYQ